MADAPMINVLCRWFEREARDLPWRKRRMRTGYGALVAETMLQQTQVSRVVEYFPRFMRAFPTVSALAQAHEQQVLAHWQGLGYYRRARYLHQAAMMIVRDFGGRVPSNVKDLMMLPGVGRYTAGAIASIVHGRAEPIVDGNVERVLRRLAGRRSPRQAREFAWKLAEQLLAQASKPGTFNEALMELGATVCLPRPASPQCDRCPVAGWCEARKAGLQQQIPSPRTRPARRTVHHHAVVVMQARSRRILVEQRAHGGMWGGLWQVPTLEADRPAALEELARLVPVSVRSLLKRGEFTHNTTHRLICVHVYRGQTRHRGGCWRVVDDLAELPMSNAQRRAIAIGLSKVNERKSGRKLAQGARSVSIDRDSAAKTPGGQA